MLFMGKSTISMAIFNCYVSSPEGRKYVPTKRWHKMVDSPPFWHKTKYHVGGSMIISQTPSYPVMEMKIYMPLLSSLYILSLSLHLYIFHYNIYIYIYTHTYNIYIYIYIPSRDTSPSQLSMSGGICWPYVLHPPPEDWSPRAANSLSWPERIQLELLEFLHISWVVQVET